MYSNVKSLDIIIIIFLQGRFYLKNRQKPTATLIYTSNIHYKLYTSYVDGLAAEHFIYADERIHVNFSSFFFFRKNYLLLSCATSVRPSVCPSVRPSVRLSVCPSVRLWK